MPIYGIILLAAAALLAMCLGFELKAARLKLKILRERLSGIEAQLAKSKKNESQMRHIINHAPISFTLGLNRVIVEINETMKKNTGLDLGDNVGGIYEDKNILDVITERLEQNNRVQNMTVRLKMADGKVHRALVNLVVVEYEGERAIAMWTTDVEAVERQKDEMRLAQASLQTVLDNFPIPVRIGDLESNAIIYANKSCIELFEYDSYSDIYGKLVVETFPEYQSDGTLTYEKVKKFRNTTDMFTVEVEYLTAKGKRIYTLLTSFIIDYLGRKSSVAVIRDMEKEREEAVLRRAVAEAEEASRAKSNFLANMSHEIRTPMNSITGFVDLALDSSPPPEIEEYLLKIRYSSEVLLSIINDILDISKIESGKLALERIPFDLHNIFLTCRTIIMPRAMENGVTLYCYAEPSVNRRLIGDPTRLRQVLINLLSNAVKFTNSGMVKLLAVIEDSGEDSVTIRFEVKDSGIGMTKEQIEKVFDPFVQADESTTRKYGGTGLGLSIVKGFVEMMGGKLKVESAVGVGSRFYFSLKFQTTDAPDEAGTGSAIISESERPVFSGEVLVCEDNSMNQQVITEHLVRVGLKPVIAENGKVCVDMVKNRIENGEKPFDLILMDIHMPVMDGVEAAKALAALGNTAPIVALTANIMTGERDTYRKHGMKGHLGKPFKQAELWECLYKYLAPVGFEQTDSKTEDDITQKRMKRLCTNFVKDNQNTFKDIYAALKAEDIVLAHRLAHTLGGVAGLIGKTELSETAREIERLLDNRKVMAAMAKMDKLEVELGSVLSELSYLLVDETPAADAEMLDKTASAALLERLEPFLAQSDSECLDFVEELRRVPGTGELIRQIEEYEFEPAYDTLAELRRGLI